MSFSIQHQHDTAASVRKIARDEAKKALAEARSDQELGPLVHKLRRRCKKLRALLRLVEPDFSGFKLENAALRDAADRLGGLRDATVLVETFDGVAQDGVPTALADAVHLHLTKRAQEAQAEQSRAGMLGAFADSFEGLAKRAKRWTFEEHGYALVRGGLKLTYRRFREELGRAEDDGSAEAFHDMRKQVKYHWQHLKLLSQIAPDLLGSRIDAADRLGKLLGDHHNLHVLVETLAQDHGQIVASELLALDAVVERRQRALEKDALALARQLCAEKPGRLSQRFSDYWKLLPEAEHGN